MDFRYRVKYALLFYQYFDVGGQLQDCQVGSSASPENTCRSTMNAFESEPDERAYYKILDTDYDTYAILYRCNDESWTGITSEFVTILSRTPTVSDAWME